MWREKIKKANTQKVDQLVFRQRVYFCSNTNMKENCISIRNLHLNKNGIPYLRKTFYEYFTATTAHCTNKTSSTLNMPIEKLKDFRFNNRKNLIINWHKSN